MRIRYAPTTCKDTAPLFGKYLSALSSVFDNYLEDHILQSQFHAVQAEAGRWTTAPSTTRSC